MQKLKQYEIPEDIRMIEFGGDESKFQHLQNLLAEFRSNEKAYIELCTAMIHLEEAAHSRTERKFDLRNVELTLCSQEKNVIKIEHNVSTIEFGLNKA